MAHIGAGAFYGYREMAVVISRHRLGPMPASLPWPRIDPEQMASMESPSFENRTFGREYAEDEFPPAFVMFARGDRFPFMSRHVVLVLKYAAVDLVYTFDGETGLELRTVTESYRAVEAAQGFMIRNSIPGNRAWWQLIVFR